MRLRQHGTTVDWDHDEPPHATIVGGIYDGHTVLYLGPVVEYKNEVYVAMKTSEGRYLYMLEEMVPEWFSVGRD
jgi:hypothetical protein